MLAHGVIYLSSSNGPGEGAVYALRASDGSMLWTYPISGVVLDAPQLLGTAISVEADNGIVYALQAHNGALRWRYLTDVGA